MRKMSKPKFSSIGIALLCVLVGIAIVLPTLILIRWARRVADRRRQRSNGREVSSGKGTEGVQDVSSASDSLPLVSIDTCANQPVQPAPTVSRHQQAFFIAPGPQPRVYSRSPAPSYATFSNSFDLTSIRRRSGNFSSIEARGYIFNRSGFSPSPPSSTFTHCPSTNENHDQSGPARYGYGYGYGYAAASCVPMPMPASVAPQGQIGGNGQDLWSSGSCSPIADRFMKRAR